MAAEAATWSLREMMPGSAFPPFWGYVREDRFSDGETKQGDPPEPVSRGDCVHAPWGAGLA